MCLEHLDRLLRGPGSPSNLSELCLEIKSSRDGENGGGCSRGQCCEIVRVEVGDADVARLSHSFCSLQRGPDSAGLCDRVAAVVEEQQVDVGGVELAQLVGDVPRGLRRGDWFDLRRVGAAAAARDPGGDEHVLAPDLGDLRRELRAVAVAVEGLDAGAPAGELEPAGEVAAAHDHHRHGAAAGLRRDGGASVHSVRRRHRRRGAPAVEGAAWGEWVGTTYCTCKPRNKSTHQRVLRNRDRRGEAEHQERRQGHH